MLPRLENEDGDRKELWWCDADDCFIAAAREAVPALVAEVRRLRDLIEILDNREGCTQ